MYSHDSNFLYGFHMKLFIPNDIPKLIHVAANLSTFIHLQLDIKKNSEDIRSNALIYHFRHEQLPKSPCSIFCDMRINTYIQSESNELYVTVELK